MKKKSVWIIVVVAAMVAIAVYQNYIVGGNTAANAKESAPKPNFAAPAFTLQGMDGQTYKVGGKRDKPLLINFWASWCDPCNEEAPDLVKNYDKYKDQIDVIAVNATQLDNLDDAKAFVQKYGYTFPVLLDPKGKVVDQYRVGGYPTSFFIDRDGVIRDVEAGLLEPKKMENEFKALING